jgi:hypothetical protein
MINFFGLFLLGFFFISTTPLRAQDEPEAADAALSKAVNYKVNDSAHVGWNR